jgi:hypothetical protein
MRLTRQGRWREPFVSRRLDHWQLGAKTGRTVTTTAICRDVDDGTPLFAQVLRADTHLDDPSFVDAANAYIFENLVVDFTLTRTLNYDILTAVDQRPE